VPVALGTAKFIESFLFGGKPNDPRAGGSSGDSSER
jgi:hypothetical protein